jgi:hypothetical protein
MRAPSSNKRERRPAQPTLSSTLTDDAKVAASITLDSVVVDLGSYWIRQLSQAWPGWWGGRELRSTTWAERSRYRGCSP